MNNKLKKIINKMEIKDYKVVRVDKSEFELDNGDVYPHNFDLDQDITIKEFQNLLDLSKKTITELIKNINK